MRLERNCPCKVNLLLNVLGKRPDGFHELETVLHPIAVCDTLSFERGGAIGIELSCGNASLPADSSNLVHRAATAFLKASNIQEGVRIHLEKRVPIAAGLGGGSTDAAHTLLGLNELFGYPLSAERLTELGASLGSDVPFFLQPGPALATGRGECIVPLQDFPALHAASIVLIYPGFGISTPWAYQQLAKFPTALHGEPGRARKLISLLQVADLRTAGSAFYNALEAPALKKHPLLAIYQEFLREHGALATLMSGSGSATFAIVASSRAAERLSEDFRTRFGASCWMATAPL